MPGFNGAGPLGNGPMTGRGAGTCNNGKTVDSENLKPVNNANAVAAFCRCGQFLGRGPNGARGGSSGRGRGARGRGARGNRGRGNCR